MDSCGDRYENMMDKMNRLGDRHKDMVDKMNMWGVADIRTWWTR